MKFLRALFCISVVFWFSGCAKSAKTLHGFSVGDTVKINFTSSEIPDYIWKIEEIRSDRFRLSKIGDGTDFNKKGGIVWEDAGWFITASIVSIRKYDPYQGSVPP